MRENKRIGIEIYQHDLYRYVMTHDKEIVNRTFMFRQKYQDWKAIPIRLFSINYERIISLVIMENLAPIYRSRYTDQRGTIEALKVARIGNVENRTENS